MKSRYCYCPCTARKIGRRVTLLARIRRRRYLRTQEAELYPVGGYYAPVYPGK